MVIRMSRPLEDWQRLASYVVSARLAAGLKDRKALEAASGVTHRTLGKLENGQRVSPDTLAAVERVVGWKPDSARRVLAGGEPVMADSPGDGDRRRHYDDARLQAIENLDFPEDVRRGMINFARGWLGINEGGEAAQMAG
jgi:transcriptional regulator with XRE-family HTH domain